jgi:hypothetical protein
MTLIHIFYCCLSGIEPENLPLEQKINTVVIRSLESDAFVLSGIDSNLVHDIAFRCPQDWGNAVHKARALYLQAGGGFERAWQDCFPIDMDLQPGENRSLIENPKDSLSQNSANDYIIVYPIPVSDMMTLLVPDTYLGAEYQVFTSTGLKLAQGIIDSQYKQISTQMFSTGLHFIQVRIPDKRPLTVKFVVQKH